MRHIVACAFVLSIGCGKVPSVVPDAGSGGRIDAASGADAAGACSTSADCGGNPCSPDGVCCNTACTGTCESCVESKTGVATGTCAPVTAGTDPDNECTDLGASSCMANGTGCNGSASAPGCNVYAQGTACGASCSTGSLTAGMCDGSGTCGSLSTTSCGGFACADGTSCLTTCSAAGGCVAADTCLPSHSCAKRLKIALVAGSGSCLVEAGNVYPVVQGLLAARGHTATMVLDTDISTAQKIAAYDVVILGGPGDGCSDVNWATYDGVLPGYVNAGGGLLAAGWTLYNNNGEAPNLATLMPSSGASYLSGNNQVDAVAGTITAGLASFTAVEYLPYGGAPKTGATTLLTSGGTPVGLGWTVGSGRSVFLGPMYFENNMSYTNTTLMDSSQPSSIEALMRAIEWAGKAD